MKRAPVAVLVSVLAMSAALALCRESSAGEPTSADKETARGLVRDGDAAFAAGNLPSALKAYQGAYDVMKVSTTGIEVVKTLDAMGKLVEARDVALEVTRIPAVEGEHPAFAAARDRAATMAAELAERIPSLRIEVRGPIDPATIELMVDGARVPAEAARLGRKVNPGPHSVSAKGPGFDEIRTEVTVKERETKPIELVLKPGAAAPVVPERPKAREPLWPLVYSGFIGGGVLVAVGAITGGVSFAKARSLVDACDKHTSDCTFDNEDSANTLAWVSDFTLPVGILGVGLGVAGLFIKHDVTPTKTAIVPIVAPGFVGLGGTF